MQGFLKFIGSVIVWGSLCVGAVAMATSYIVPVAPAEGDPAWFRAGEGVTGSDEDPKVGPNGYLRTTSNAGPLVARDGAEAPLFPAGTELTPETVEAMIGDDPAGPVVRRVKVASWSWARWSTKYVFLGACGGLIVGGILVRFAGRISGANAVSEDVAVEETPAGAIAAARAMVQRVIAKAPDAEDMGEALRLVNDELGELQQSHLAAFAEAREALIGRYGLAKFAGIMDRFAEGERAVNRAWSAAADGRIGPVETGPDMLAEALDSLAIADAAFGDTAELLDAGATRAPRPVDFAGV
ncbi:MAG: hypothetical protein CMJ31_10000 [Phycisphaerae bacterium]|nr:hypothetical protein [Phycisphaerae bacterium]